MTEQENKDEEEIPSNNNNDELTMSLDKPNQKDKTMSTSKDINDASNDNENETQNRKDPPNKSSASSNDEKLSATSELENGDSKESNITKSDVENKEDNNKEGEDDDDDEEIIPESDISNPNRRIWVVTTASLPWRTGTAVNPLARALYLTRGRPKHHVGLVVPWLEDKEDQAKIFGEDSTFATKEDQEKWIRQYCKDRVNCESKYYYY